MHSQRIRVWNGADPEVTRTVYYEGLEQTISVKLTNSQPSTTIDVFELDGELLGRSFSFAAGILFGLADKLSLQASTSIHRVPA